MSSSEQRKSQSPIGAAREKVLAANEKININSHSDSEAESMLAQFAPAYQKNQYTAEQRDQIKPFFSNLDQSVYTPLIFSPEVIGALCSRTSRASDDLRAIFLKEYVTPFLEPTKSVKESAEDWAEKKRYGAELQEFITFLQKHPVEKIFSNPRARSFYIKWLAQYGDDSIAQMAGTHLVYASLSMLAIKHFEDQRIGLAPIEKSTRYVDYGSKVNGKYRYYVDPTLSKIGLTHDYRNAMDSLFATYVSLIDRLTKWLAKKFPKETKATIRTKAYDTLRGLLPTSTLSQVAFFGNGQAFEYMISRSLAQPLGEVRWAANRAYEELYTVVPSFLRRLRDSDQTQNSPALKYQEYLAGRGQRVASVLERHRLRPHETQVGTKVVLVDFDPDGEIKVITGILYSAPNNHRTWHDLFDQVKAMSTAGKREILDAYFEGRDQRWQKAGRALENVYVRFEIQMNIGAWRDLHRHRMLTQQRQHFTIEHGYDVPLELIQAGLDAEFHAAVRRVADVYRHIAAHDLDLAQYAVTMAHRVRFMQWTNLRSCFWEIELRTIPEGHPDYRIIEQEKFKLLEQVYPLLAERMHVNLGTYTFARRGQEEKIKAKLSDLERQKI